MTARLDMCWCNEHGRIIQPDDSWGEEFCFQAWGMHVARGEVLNPRDAEQIVFQIQKSKMPRRYEEVSPETIWKIEEVNTLRRHREDDATQRDAVHLMLRQEVDSVDLGIFERFERLRKISEECLG